MNELVEKMLDDGAEPHIALAIHSLRPDATWDLTGNKYSGLNWQDATQLVPTEQEIIDEIEHLRTIKESIEYRHTRETEYLPLREQLDMQYWDQINGTTTWQDHITEVKTNNPKPV